MVFKKKVESSKETSSEKGDGKSRLGAIDEFAKGCGLVAVEDTRKEHPKEAEGKWDKVLIRVRSDVLEEIDRSKSKRMGLTRTAWISEAIQEKLELETS